MEQFIEHVALHLERFLEYPKFGVPVIPIVYQWIPALIVLPQHRVHLSGIRITTAAPAAIMDGID